MTDLVSQLSELVMHDADFQELAEQQDVYCPFEALSVARMEIRHSNFLADILTPSGSHGFGDAVLRKFVERLLIEAQESNLALTAHLGDLSSVQILRERDHIDLMIVFPRLIEAGGDRKDLVLVIELKVEASESLHQLTTYEHKAAVRFPNALRRYFFVTPDQSEASQDNWINIGFEAMIGSFNDAINEVSGDPAAEVMLQAYIDMLRRRYVSNPELEAIAQRIWSKHRAALEYLIEQRPNPLSDVFDRLASDEFFARFREQLAHAGCPLNVDLDTRKRRIIAFAVKDWDSLADMGKAEKWTPTNRIVLGEIEITPEVIRNRIVLGRGDQTVRQRVYDALRVGGAQLDYKRSNLTKEYSSFASKRIRGQAEIEKLIDGEFNDEDITRLMDDIIHHFVTVLPSYHEALMNSDLERGSAVGPFPASPHAASHT